MTWTTAASRSLVGLLLVCTAASPVAAQRAGGRGSGRVVGYVTIDASGEPLPYADATIERLEVGTFSGTDGTFRLRDLPAGPVSIRVRRIGFRPVVVAVNVSADREDTVRVALAPLALALAGVRVTSAVCPRRAGGDTITLALLEQIRMNAERARLMAAEYPFVTMLERTVGDEQPEPALFGGAMRQRIVRLDTLVLAAEHPWQYAPGELIAASADTTIAGASETMVVPQLTDLADDAFIAAHCFRYAGLQSIGGVQRVRVDFEPSKEIRHPDLRGAIYLDATTSQIVQTRMVLERPSPLAPATDVWTLTMDTRFAEILPALPVIQGLCSRTTGTSLDSRGNRRLIGRVAIETQRLIRFEFTDEAPGVPAAAARTPDEPCFGPRAVRR